MEDFDALTLEENHRLGRKHFNAGRFFPAHEAWETAWKQARGPRTRNSSKASHSSVRDTSITGGGTRTGPEP